MKLFIGERKKNKYRDEVVVEIETMIGDADGYQFLTIPGFKKDDTVSLTLLFELIELLEKMQAEYPNGRGGSDDYNHVPGFDKWFNEDFDFDEHLSDTNPADVLFEDKFLGESWPCDPNGWGIQSSMKTYKISYFDENGYESEAFVK